MPVISSIGDGSLGEGKDHQAKASEEYSTEKRRRRRRTGFFADDVHGAPLQDVKESQVSGQQADKDFSVVQNQDAGHERAPRYEPQGQSQRKSAQFLAALHRPEQHFFGYVIGEQSEQQKREACPLRSSQPRL